jgi:hypothetical protein
MPLTRSEDEMKKFEVEFRRTSYITYTVDAESVEEAERTAWIGIPDHEFNSADWDVESVTEVKGESNADAQ